MAGLLRTLRPIPRYNKITVTTPGGEELKITLEYVRRTNVGLRLEGNPETFHIRPASKEQQDEGTTPPS